MNGGTRKSIWVEDQKEWVENTWFEGFVVILISMCFIIII